MRYQSATIQEAIDALRDKGKAWMIVPFSPSTTIEELAGSDGVIVEETRETEEAEPEKKGRIKIDRDAILELVKSGSNAYQISKKLGYAYTTVNRYLQEAGYNAKGELIEHPIDYDMIEALAKAGRSPKWISDDMRVPVDVVSKHLLENGLIKEEEEC